MPFIHLTTPSGRPVHLNVHHIVGLEPDPEGGCRVASSVEERIWYVRESVDEVMMMIEPDWTPAEPPTAGAESPEPPTEPEPPVRETAEPAEEPRANGGFAEAQAKLRQRLQTGRSGIRTGR